MKILLITPSFQPAWECGGIVRAVWNLARGLAKLGPEVTVVTTNANLKGVVNVPPVRMEEDVKIITATVIAGGNWSIANKYGMAPGMVLNIAEQIGQNDIIHVNGFFGYHAIVAAAIAFGKSKPLIITSHGSLDKWSLAQKRMKKELFLRSVGKLIFRQSAGIHFTVEEEERQAPHWLVGDKGFVVPNAVEFTTTGDAAGFRKKIKAESGVLIIAIIGRIHKKKGFDVILPAMAKCKRDNLIMVIAGPDEGGYRSKVEEMVRETGLGNRVIFTNMLTRNDLADAYAGVDLLVVPSYEENFGNVIVEATAQGTPCMVSDQVGLKDWVSENNIGLVLPLNANNWAAVLGNVRREDITRNWNPRRLSRLARESFSMETVARQMLAHYEKILGRVGRRVYM